MSSTYFRAGNQSSDEEENEERIEVKKSAPSYEYSASFSSDRTDTKRLFQDKDRRGIFRNFSNKIDNALKNSDYGLVWDILQEYIKEVEKAATIIQKESSSDVKPDQRILPIFLQTLIDINDVISAFNTQDKAQMKKNTLSSFNFLRNKLKNKIIPQFQNELEDYETKAKIEPIKQEAPEAEGQKDDDMDKDSSSDDSMSQDGSQEDEEDQKTMLESGDIMVRRSYWLKKVEKEEDEQTKKENKKKEEEKNEKNDKKEKDEKNQKKLEKKKKVVEEPVKKKIQITSFKDVQAKIKSIVSKFSKLSHEQERHEHLADLDKILEKFSTFHDFEKLSFLLAGIPIRVEVERQNRPTHFSRAVWNKILVDITSIHQLIRESQEADLFENIVQFDEMDTTKRVVNEVSMYLNIKSFVLLLDSELRKAFLFIEHAEMEYAERLQDMIRLTNFIYQVSNEMSTKEETEKDASELSFKVLENMYFMNKKMLTKVGEDSKTAAFAELADPERLQQYSEQILRYADNNLVVKTILMLAFNHAVNGRDEGRQLFVTTNIAEAVQTADYFTQALYNRVIVQLGVCAFEKGNFHEVTHYLSELCNTSKNKEQTRDFLRECLAQGGPTREPEKEIPKQRLLPYYLHFSLEFVELIELIAAMLNQVPNLLSEGSRVNSKTFRRICFQYERSHFIAEPLNSRDLVYAASLELRMGRWLECFERLSEVSFWSEFNDAELTKTNLLRYIKEQALKCFLIGNRRCFKSICLKNLAESYELTERQVTRLISKWIYNRELDGSIGKGHLNFVLKRESDMDKTYGSLYRQLLDSFRANELILRQKGEGANGVVEEEEEQEKENVVDVAMKSSLAMNERLKAIIKNREK